MKRENKGEYPKTAGQYSRSFEHLATLHHLARSLSKPGEVNRTQLCPSVEFLEKFGVSGQLLEMVTRNASANQTNAAEVLIGIGRLTQDAYYRSLAAHISVPFVGSDDIDMIMFGTADPALCLQPNAMVWARLTSGDVVMLLAPQGRKLDALTGRASHPFDDRGVAMTSPEIIRAKTVECAGRQICEKAAFAFAAASPGESARTGPGFVHGSMLVLFGMLVVAGLALQPFHTGLVITSTLSLFFLVCVLVRICAAVGSKDRFSRLAPLTGQEPAERPIYSVMVTVYREAEVVPDLIRQLKALQWPPSKLEIKLICEADDFETIKCIQQQKLDGRFEIIKVPAVGPRTKPKALCYALPFTTGTYITLYDAEDRPDPLQLDEAWRTFATAPADLACLQAPLDIANPGQNLLTSLFHLEYSGLFHGLLPWLAKHRFPLPLGGTSNHFRRDALVAVGAWDPFNVTEDADLGFRLARNGYRSSVIERPTLEDATDEIRYWIPQRTRWFKGWMQTWIVNTRNTMASLKSGTPMSFLISHVFLTGLIASALLHPLILLNALILTLWITGGLPYNATMVMIAWLEWYVLALSYVSFFALSWQATKRDDKRKIWKAAPLIPAYWLLMSWAAWRAFGQMFTDPFKWEKTPHKAHRTSGQSGS